MGDRLAQVEGEPDGTGARLPLRWPGGETGKTRLFTMPPRPVDTARFHGTNPPDANRFPKP